MALSAQAKKATRSLTWLVVIVAALGIFNGIGVVFQGASWTPKLALDLEGGTQIVLSPKLESGESVSSEQMSQAVSIIRQRVDASGVSEAEINTQGNNNIVVSIPGQPDDATLQRIQSSAKLEFRPVLETGAPTATTFVGTDGVTTPAPTAVPSGLASVPATSPTSGSDPAWVTPLLQAQYDVYQCSSSNSQQTNAAPANEPLITCDVTNTVKYLLGPVEVSGTQIADATSGQVTTSTGATTGQWAVNLSFNAEGTTAFSNVTARLSGLQGAQNQFAILIDGKVITAPATNEAITAGKAQITGGFTQATAKTLADQLKYGALPIGFQVQSSDTISATLGSAQLMAGLLAGGIGLLLVIIYSLFQYRMLGLVTVASLVVAATLTYLIVTLLSWREGYRLSLAGVAGLIVAIGITADSFIVYFERVRDELRDGRGLPSAVESGWKRAIRTIIASDMVNFLAAGVLFVLAVGNVRGFALTLGLTTIVDIVVVVLFTHPMMQLLAQTEFYGGGHPWSGLDSKALGAVYRGRAQFSTADRVTAGKAASSSKEALKRQTIAERKAAQATQNEGGQ